MENLLIGKIIVDVKIASDKKALLFITSDGENLIARTDGDCCSYSWVESIELPALGFPFSIVKIEDLDLPGGDDEGELKVYGAKIITNKGETVIDYRNESNGYYGGNISWPGDDYFYGGVHGQNVSNEDWQSIEE